MSETSFTEPVILPESAVATSPLLESINWLRHASSTRRFNSPLSDRVQDLRRMQNLIGAGHTRLVHADQRHTSNVAIVDENLLKQADDTGRYCVKNTDSLVTALPGVSIAVLTADCAPVFVVDTARKLIAVAHAGWKGTLARIVENTVKNMSRNGGEPSSMVAWVGPMAGGCCYEVSQELLNAFGQEFGDLQATGLAKGRMLDLVEINARQLVNAGLPPTSVHRSNLCTIHHREHFYSYRADSGTHGRIISMMAIVPPAGD